jgi:sugar/nucleoside kinase (ribokinase family)
LRLCGEITNDSYANATAALCATKPGAAPSMPIRKEVETLLD